MKQRKPSFGRAVRCVKRVCESCGRHRPTRAHLGFEVCNGCVL